MIVNGQTNINLIGLIFTLTMGLLILCLARRYAILPIIMTACYITLGQVIAIASLDFTMLRITIFFALMRVIIRKEIFSIRFHKIDKILIAYAFVSSTAYILLRGCSSEAIINRLGFLYNSFLIYIIFRALIRDIGDIYAIFKMFALVVVPLAAAMIIEKVTGRNLFSIFGGVPEFTKVREGTLRCQGSFAHPILAGTFGATSLPFMLALWFRSAQGKWITGLGMVSATIITIAAGSSGPVMAYIAVVIGIAMWRIRYYMRAVRWGLALSLIVMHMIMKGPVWDLIGKLSNIMGGTGWHRVMLINAAVAHFDEWWLLGVDYTRHWMPTGVSWSQNHADITNNFISVGIHGGLISLILFLAIIVCCFNNLGVKLKEVNSSKSPVKLTLWCMGVSLFSHLVSFISVNYFDQIIIFWYLLLALIATIAMIPVEILIGEDKCLVASRLKHPNLNGGRI